MPSSNVIFTEDKPTIECPRCKSLLANDDPALFGKRVECPKCGAFVRLPRSDAPEGSTDTWSEKQLLSAIRSELIKTNKMLSLFYVFAILNLIGIVLYVLMAIIALAA